MKASGGKKCEGQGRRGEVRGEKERERELKGGEILDE